MAMLIDIRKINMEHFLNELVDAAKIRTKWWGKKVDNYWLYLDNNMERVQSEIDPYIISDLFVYVFDKLNYKEKLTDYSAKISTIRKNFFTILIIDDKDFLINSLSENSFLSSFMIFLMEFNGEFYSYEDAVIEETISNFKTVLGLINNEYGLLVNIG
jgi:hypothetical protein